jgi:hypothetical protein
MHVPFQEDPLADRWTGYVVLITLALAVVQVLV